MPQRIICFGNSITEASDFAPGERWTAGLQEHLSGWRPGRYEVISRGISGNTTADARQRLEPDVLPLLPALVLIEFGFNDANVYPDADRPRVELADYRRNLEAIDRTISERGGEIVYIINHTVNGRLDIQGNGKRYADNFAPYNQALRTLAARLGRRTIDLPAMLAKQEVPLARFLDEDGVHLSGYGNEVYAKLVFEALEAAL